MTNITTSVSDRRRQREDAAHHQVFDRIGVDVDAVHGVAGVGRDVMMQTAAPAGARTGGRAGRRPCAGRYRPAPACRMRSTKWLTICSSTPATTMRTSTTTRLSPAISRQPPRHGSGNGCVGVVEDVVDDHLQRPRLQRAERDLRRPAAPTGQAVCRRYGRRYDSIQESSDRLSDGRHAHGRVTRPRAPGGAVRAAAGGVGTRRLSDGERDQAGRRSSRRLEPAARVAAYATRVGVPNVIRPSSLTSRMMPSGPTARTWPL